MVIAISALQRNAAAVVRGVAASGVAEEITERGRVVAILSPPPTASGIERLRQQGLTSPPDSTPWEELFAMADAEAPVRGLLKALDEQRDSDR